MGKFKTIIVVLALLLVTSYVLAYFLDTEIGDKIAIVPIKGTILGSDSTSFLTTNAVLSQDIVTLLKEAEKNNNVKGIVLAINSPGGTVLASKEIVEAIKGTEKPTVAWIREIGTSGAYWAASASDAIVADELSLTGSIGVISTLLEFSDLFEEYGVTYEGLKTGKYKDIGSPYKKMTEEERVLLLKKLDLIHDYFVEDVSKNRNLPLREVEDFSNGIYYLGIEAKELGLVDYLGGKELAINITKELANITEADTIIYEKKKGWIAMLSEITSEGFFYMGKGMGSEIGKVDVTQTMPQLT
tara:strand:+ start:11920 stop:12819 length:900 start_codon:yes stop_codon:yes gene_type:complete